MQAVREETEVFMESLEADKRAAADHFWECQRADEMRRSAPSPALCYDSIRLGESASLPLPPCAFAWRERGSPPCTAADDYCLQPPRLPHAAHV